MLLRKTAFMFALAAIWGHSTYGTEKPRLQDRSGNPVYPANLLESVATLDLPPGNVTVSELGRVFFTFFPGAKPDIKVAELVDGKAVPFPDAETQRSGALHFQSVLSLRADRQGRLWILDSGNYGLGSPRLVAFDLRTNEISRYYEFPKSVAPIGSYLNDFAVSADGEWIFITDSSNVARRGALVAYDVKHGTSRRLLENHVSTRDGDYDVFVDDVRMKFWGVLPLHFGADGISLDAKEEWLYFNPLNSGSLYRVPVGALKEPSLPDEALEVLVEKYADSTINDGILAHPDGNVYVTDPEHYALLRVTPERKLETVFKDRMLRWPDGLSLAPDGWIYLSCSSLQDVFPKPIASEVRKKGPFHIFRFRLPN